MIFLICVLSKYCLKNKKIIEGNIYKCEKFSLVV